MRSGVGHGLTVSGNSLSIKDTVRRGIYAAHGMAWNEKSKVQIRVYRKPPWVSNVKEKCMCITSLLDFLDTLLKKFQETGGVGVEGRKDAFLFYF